MTTWDLSIKLTLKYIVINKNIKNTETLLAVFSLFAVVLEPNPHGKRKLFIALTPQDSSVLYRLQHAV
jgi:hypothetical protein